MGIRDSSPGPPPMPPDTYHWGALLSPVDTLLWPQELAQVPTQSGPGEPAYVAPRDKYCTSVTLRCATTCQRPPGAEPWTPTSATHSHSLHWAAAFLSHVPASTHALPVTVQMPGGLLSLCLGVCSWDSRRLAVQTLSQGVGTRCWWTHSGTCVSSLLLSTALPISVAVTQPPGG